MQRVLSYQRTLRWKYIRPRLQNRYVRIDINNIYSLFASRIIAANVAGLDIPGSRAYFSCLSSSSPSWCLVLQIWRHWLRFYSGNFIGGNFSDSVDVNQIHGTVLILAVLQDRKQYAWPSFVTAVQSVMTTLDSVNECEVIKSVYSV